MSLILRRAGASSYLFREQVHTSAVVPQVAAMVGPGAAGSESPARRYAPSATRASASPAASADSRLFRAAKGPYWGVRRALR